MAVQVNRQGIGAPLLVAPQVEEVANNRMAIAHKAFEWTINLLHPIGLAIAIRNVVVISACTIGSFFLFGLTNDDLHPGQNYRILQIRRAMQRYGKGLINESIEKKFALPLVLTAVVGSLFFASNSLAIYDLRNERPPASRRRERPGADLDSRLNLNKIKGHFKAMSAPIPDKVPDISFDQVKTILTDPAVCSRLDREKVLKMVDKIEAREAWLMVPSEEPAKSKWFDDATKMLKLVASKIGEGAKDISIRKGLIQEFKQGADFCGARYMDVLNQAWGELTSNRVPDLESDIASTLHEYAMGLMQDNAFINPHQRNRTLHALKDSFGFNASTYDENDVFGEGENPIDLEGYRRQFYFLFNSENITPMVRDAFNGVADENGERKGRSLEFDTVQSWFFENVTVPEGWLPTNNWDDEGLYLEYMSAEELRGNLETLRRAYTQEIVFDDQPAGKSVLTDEWAEFMLTKMEFYKKPRRDAS